MNSSCERRRATLQAGILREHSQTDRYDSRKPDGGSRKTVSGIDFWRPDGIKGLVLHRGASATHPYPRHWHEELHLCLYTAGSGFLGYRGNSYLVSAGSLVLTPPGEVHENWVKKGSGCSFRGVYFEVELLRRAARYITDRDSPPGFSLKIFQDAMLKESLTRLHNAFDFSEIRLRREELVLELAGLLVTGYSKTDHLESDVGCERQAVRLTRSFIDEHFAGSITLEELGRLTKLSPFHLHRVFRRQTGMPPHAYQIQVQVNRAKQLLLRGRPLAEVALATGFADQSHLTRHFRRLVGVTPGRYAC